MAHDPSTLLARSRPWTACAVAYLVTLAGCSADGGEPGAPSAPTESARDFPEHTSPSGREPPQTGGLLPEPGGTETPPATWKEHWFEHTQELKLVAQNDWVAMYFDDAVRRQGTEWLLPFMTKVWQYTVAHYGPFTDGRRDGRLYAIFHEGKYGGGHPSTYLQASHDHRNVSDVGPGPWHVPSYDVASHEVSHIVEYASFGVYGSPSTVLWMDSKWAEFYQYDLYLGIGMTDQARVVFDRFSAATDSYPRPGTRWFRDWFYPLWRDHGGVDVMVRYFRLLAENFPKSGNRFSRDMNFGEFVHFSSGAARTDLRALATSAFGWPAAREAEFEQAQADFPNVRY